MGLFRLFLAILVVLGHMDISFLDLHISVSAVVVFYVLAGHVVSTLWRKSPEENVASRAMWFYKDRALRIFPLYLSVMAFSSILWMMGAHSSFLSRTPLTLDWLGNLLVVPLNYYMFNGLNDFFLVPPAWSLGVELQFYLLVPLLLTSRAIVIGFGLASFLCYALAQCGVLNADYYGYRLIAGVGFIFIAGTLINRHDLACRLCLSGVWLASVIYSGYLAATGTSVAYNLDVALGFAVGLPLLYLFLRFPRSGFLHLLQKRAGEISYGVFLFHFPVMWMLQLLGYQGKSTAIFVVLVSAVMAWGAHSLIERPVWAKFRPALKT